MTVISIIGAPTDIGANISGCELAPSVLRGAGLVEVLCAQGVQVTDFGDICGPANPFEHPLGGIRHLDRVFEWNSAIFSSVHAALEDGALPILVGGDHSLAIGSISAVARFCRSRKKPLHVLWIDAHADSNHFSTSPTGNIHGMPVACLLGHGPAPLVGLAGYIPAISVTDISLIGVRAVDVGEQRFIDDVGLRLFDMDHIESHGMRATIESILKELPLNSHLHVSFDIDGLSPTVAPGVGTPEVGGLTYLDAKEIMDSIARANLLGSLDIVELNPLKDIAGTTSRITLDMVRFLFNKCCAIP
jgi:arginase